jgi:DNA-binding XRE family transcriptional regulator
MTQAGEALERVWQYIDTARVELDLTWDELARISGVTRATYYNIQAGRNPTKLTRKKIEDALDWGRGSIAKIIKGEEPIRLRGTIDPRTASAEQLGELLEQSRESFIEELGEEAGMHAFAELFQRTMTIRARKGQPGESTTSIDSEASPACTPNE